MDIIVNCLQYFELLFGIHSSESRTFFILINTLLIMINFGVSISIIVAMLKWRKQSKLVDTVRVTRLKELDNSIDIEVQKLDHVSAQLGAIEQAILVCHELHRKN